jgi:ubiquinone/menaquinone biosynthesis C-methylase UbiE
MPAPTTEHNAVPAGLPSDYYHRIHEVEQRHWWHRGMREISAALLGPRLSRTGQRLLDAGCGTGGFLRWAQDTGAFGHLSGVDIAPGAIELARERVPGAALSVTSLADLPYGDSSFDVVVVNDVLQHVAEAELEQSLGEVRRVLRPDGVLLLRTNGARHARRERDDWRIYDRAALAAILEAAGLRCERLTYANVALSLLAAARGTSPRAPTDTSHGIPAPASPLQNALGYRALRAEARYLAGGSRALPYGHTLLALASPDTGASSPGAGNGRDAPAFFDGEAARYDRAYGAAHRLGGHTLRTRLNAAVRLLGDGPGEVLDAGMGPGRLCAALDRKGWTVTGIDGSQEMVDLARERLPHARERLLRARIEVLPFADGSFDAVAVTGVLEYVEDRAAVLQELARVLRPGGQAVVSIPNVLSIPSLWRRNLVYPAVRAAKKLGLVRRAPFRRKRPPRRRRFEAMLADAGLRVESVERLGFTGTQILFAARKPR